MSYLTLAQLADRPGADEIAEAATPKRYPVVDSRLLDALLRNEPVDSWPAEEQQIAQQVVDIVSDAMEQAHSMINGFLRQRGYALPLSQPFPIVTGWSRSITRYLLHKDHATTADDPIVRDYRDALKLLQLTADGKFSLGADDPVADSKSASPEFSAPGRIFSAGALKDY